MSEIIKPLTEVASEVAYYAQESYGIALEGCRMANKGFRVGCRLAEKGYEVAQETYGVAKRGLEIGYKVAESSYGIARDVLTVSYGVAETTYNVAEDSYKIATNEKYRDQKVAEWTTSAKELAKSGFVVACGAGAVGTAGAVTIVAVPHLIQLTFLNSLLALLTTSGVANIVGNDNLLLAAQLAFKGTYNAGQAAGAWALEKATELTTDDDEEITIPVYHHEKEAVESEEEIPQLRIWGENGQLLETN